MSPYAPTRREVLSSTVAISAGSSATGVVRAGVSRAGRSPLAVPALATVARKIVNAVAMSTSVGTAGPSSGWPPSATDSYITTSTSIANLPAQHDD